MNKDDLRKLMKEKRKCIPNKEEKSKIIVDRLLTLNIMEKASLVALYKSFSSEVNTDYLISRLITNKKVLLPRVNKEELEFIIIDSNTTYMVSNMGITEPINNNVCNEKIDLIIIPGLAFDKKRYRLGFGKGYYDRYLMNNSIYKIGICFDKQIVDTLPIDEWDVPMDLIITEKRIIKKV